MKSIILSIQPYYYYHIVVVKDKKIELRKTIAKPPFVANLYCSKNMKSFNRIQFRNEDERQYMLSVMGKVGARFDCNKVTKLDFDWIAFNGSGTEKFLISQNDLIKTCLTQKEIVDYACNNHRSSMNSISALHISNLNIYDKPKELRQFRIERTTGFYALPYDVSTYSKIKRLEPITRPPQSWQYVENWEEHR